MAVRSEGDGETINVVPPASHIVLLGAMGSGKSTLGAVLAKALGVAFVDSDDQILALTGNTGADIAASNGIESLHRLERQVLTEALAALNPSVIAAAASVIDNPAVRVELSRFRCIWVDAEPDVLADRREKMVHRRWLPRGEADALNRRRDAAIEEVAIGRVDTGTQSVEQSLALALGLLRPKTSWQDPS